MATNTTHTHHTASTSNIPPSSPSWPHHQDHQASVLGAADALAAHFERRALFSSASSLTSSVTNCTISSQHTSSSVARPAVGPQSGDGQTDQKLFDLLFSIQRTDGTGREGLLKALTTFVPPTPQPLLSYRIGSCSGVSKMMLHTSHSLSSSSSSRRGLTRGYSGGPFLSFSSSSTAASAKGMRVTPMYYMLGDGDGRSLRTLVKFLRVGVEGEGSQEAVGGTNAEGSDSDDAMATLRGLLLKPAACYCLSPPSPPDGLGSSRAEGHHFSVKRKMHATSASLSATPAYTLPKQLLMKSYSAEPSKAKQCYVSDGGNGSSEEHCDGSSEEDGLSDGSMMWAASSSARGYSFSASQTEGVGEADAGCVGAAGVVGVPTLTVVHCAAMQCASSKVFEIIFEALKCGGGEGGEGYVDAKEDGMAVTASGASSSSSSTCKAIVNTLDHRERTALQTYMFACSQRNDDPYGTRAACPIASKTFVSEEEMAAVVKLFFAAGADPIQNATFDVSTEHIGTGTPLYDRSSTFHTAVMMSSKTASKKVLRAFLEDGGTDINSLQTYLRLSALRCCIGDADATKAWPNVSEEEECLFSWLLRRGADVNLVTSAETGSTIGTAAATPHQHRSSDAMELLLQHGLSTDVIESRGETLLHTAIAFSRLGDGDVCRQIIRALLDRGADVNAVVNVAVVDALQPPSSASDDTCTTTAVGCSSSSSSSSSNRHHTISDEDHNAYAGMTALHMAVVSFPDPPTLSLLLSEGADAHAVDAKGKTPLALFEELSRGGGTNGGGGVSRLWSRREFDAAEVRRILEAHTYPFVVTD